MKKCFKCGIEKPLVEFYKHSQMADGYINKCKDCTRIESCNNYKKNMQNEYFIEKEKKRGREKSKKRKNRINNPKRNEKYFNKYPEKEIAKNKSATLIKPFNNAERHHWSYNEEHYKDVIWLIKKDHMKSHRFIVYDQERMMYRRCDTNELLDTKEKHKQFILWCIENKDD